MVTCFVVTSEQTTQSTHWKRMMTQYQVKWAWPLALRGLFCVLIAKITEQGSRSLWRCHISLLAKLVIWVCLDEVPSSCFALTLILLVRRPYSSPLFHYLIRLNGLSWIRRWHAASPFSALTVFTILPWAGYRHTPLSCAPLLLWETNKPRTKFCSLFWTSNFATKI